MMKARMRRRRGKSAAQMIRAAKEELVRKKIKALAKPRRVKVTVQEAKERTDHIKGTFQRMGKMWWELGSEVRRAIEDRVPEVLGQSVHEWMTECFGDSWLRIYRAHRIMKALLGVKLKVLERISEGNAYALARLPETVRKSSDWIKRASTLKNEEFRQMVDECIAKKTGIKDPMVKIVDVLGIASIPKSLEAVVKRAIELAARAHSLDLDEKGGRLQALEAIFAEYIATYGGADEEREVRPLKARDAG